MVLAKECRTVVEGHSKAITDWIFKKSHIFEELIRGSGE